MMCHEISSEHPSESAEPRVSVVLTGSESDIRKLADHYNDMATGWIRRHRGTWVLSSSILEHATDSTVAIRMACDAIEHQNSAMFLISDEYSGVSVSEQVIFIDNGKTTIHLTISDTVSASVAGVFIHSGQDIHSDQGSTVAPDLFAQLAKSDFRIRVLSTYLPKLHGDWHDLYSFAESIGPIIPGTGGGSGLRKLKRAVALGWMSERERKHFARAANAARHEGSLQQKRLMPVSTGRHLMKRIARKLWSHVQDDAILN